MRTLPMLHILLRFGLLLAIALVCFAILFVICITAKNPIIVILFILLAGGVAVLDMRSTYGG